MRGEKGFKRGQLRGYIFEVVVRHLLKKNGWSLLSANESERIRINGEYKIEIKGRGTWHQIDTPCIFSRRIPFTYPLRLLVEAKYYNHEVNKDKIRSFIGVIKDISENYFIDGSHTIDSQNRYTDLGVFFSANGFQEQAVNLAFAHGIKTISYRTNQQMAEIKKDIELLESDGLSWRKTISFGKHSTFMRDLENLLEDYSSNINNFLEKYDMNNRRNLLSNLHESLLPVKTSFFGMTSTGVLLHFLSKDLFPDELFANSDEELCKIYYDGNPLPQDIPIWLEFSADEQRRRFYFDVPAGLEEVILKGEDVLSEKERNFGKLSVSLFIKGILRSLTLKIDKDWIDKLKGRKVG